MRIILSLIALGFTRTMEKFNRSHHPRNPVGCTIGKILRIAPLEESSRSHSKGFLRVHTFGQNPEVSSFDATYSEVSFMMRPTRRVIRTVRSSYQWFLRFFWVWTRMATNYTSHNPSYLFNLNHVGA